HDSNQDQGKDGGQFELPCHPLGKDAQNDNSGDLQHRLKFSENYSFSTEHGRLGRKTPACPAHFRGRWSAFFYHFVKQGPRIPWVSGICCLDLLICVPFAYCRTIYPIACGNFKLDGGAMFGVVPKPIWNRTNPADANNMIDLGTRSLLIEDGDRLILIDTGLGDKQSEKFFSYYHLWGDHSLDGSLKKAGFHRDEITDVFLTHLHFDHCGGSVAWNRDRSGYEPAFKNAKFWTNAEHWQWATKPNAREKASFLSEN